MTKKANLEQIKKLRSQTKAGIMDCRLALEETEGDFKKAQEWLRKKGIASANKRTGRQANCGLIESYSHGEGRVVSVVELNCETDFVARNAEFKKLAHELAMQVAAMNPKNVDELLKQAYIRDASITVSDLVNQLIGKIRENIKINRLARFALGE